MRVYPLMVVCLTFASHRDTSHFGGDDIAQRLETQLVARRHKNQRRDDRTQIRATRMGFRSDAADYSRRDGGHCHSSDR